MKHHPEHYVPVNPKERAKEKIVNKVKKQLVSERLRLEENWRAAQGHGHHGAAAYYWDTLHDENAWRSRCTELLEFYTLQAQNKKKKRRNDAKA